RKATEVAAERGAYFVHPHLDPNWTDGYQRIAEEILEALPGCRTLVFPLGGGGLLMGVSDYLLRANRRDVRLVGCEPYNYPKYASFDHTRSKTIADGLLLEVPHPKVQERIEELAIRVDLVADADIRTSLRELFRKQALRVEPSSAITTAFVQTGGSKLEDPVCVVLTGENIAPEDFSCLLTGD